MASEQKKIELEKICAVLEIKITAKNQELADLNKEIHARTQAGEGDVLAATAVLKKEIADLEAKKADLSSFVTAGLAEVTAEKIANASEAERLKNMKFEIEANRAATDMMMRDIETREAKLSSDAQEFNAAKAADAERVHRAQETISQAARDSDEAGRKMDAAAGILKDAEAKMKSAETAVADLTAKSESKLKEAEEIRDQAEQDKIALSNQLKEALSIKEEYTAKLAESQTFAALNSEVSGKLSIWEAALRSTERRLDDEKAILATAQEEFVKQSKQGVL